MKTYRWKFLREGFKSQHGTCEWKIGEQKEITGELLLCGNGFHCSKEIGQAFSYVQGEILAKVECSGKHISETDKDVWEKMKVVKAYKWQKKDSVAISIYAAELCIKNYEKTYPNDERPHKAIEAAKEYLKNPTEENREKASAAESAASAAESAAESAAWSAASAARSAAWSAASAARSAASAAWSAAESAASAARSAASAAESAARSAASAAESAAWSAAWSAAESATYKKIYKRFDKQVKELEEIK